MMNLKDFLVDYIGVEVKLGSKAGFVYCDKLPEDYVELLTDLSEKEYAKLIYYKNKHEAHLINFDYFWVKKIDTALKDFRKIKRPRITKEQLLDDLDARRKVDFKKTKEAVTLYKKRIKTFTPFLTRNVREVYDSEYDIGTKIILFEGEEQGQFWFKNEVI